MADQVRKTWFVTVNPTKREGTSFASLSTARDHADELAAKPGAGMVYVFECVAVVQAVPVRTPVHIIPFYPDVDDDGYGYGGLVRRAPTRLGSRDEPIIDDNGEEF